MEQTADADESFEGANSCESELWIEWKFCIKNVSL